ncbi:MAG: peptidylprolyl isomerase [Chloroflexi bacterium]|nr:peptidylprolyl isomerase [Chloroflexota bacterium]MBI5712767.1 peptidylprolyl isomerase [Chloroflexota bacterium]
MTQSKPPRILHKKHIARAQREANLRRWVIGVSLGIVALIVAVIGYGIADQYVIQPGQPVAKVGSSEVSTGTFQKAVKYQRYVLIQEYFQVAQIAQFFGNDPYYQQQLEQIIFQLTNSQTMGRQVLNNVIDEEIIRQEATKRNITIPANEVDKALQEAFGYFANGTPTSAPTLTAAPTATLTLTPTLVPGVTPTLAPTIAPTATTEPTLAPTAGPSPTPLPTATPYTLEGYQKSFGDFTSNLTKTSGMTGDDLRRLIETNLIRKKLQEVIAKDTPRDTVEAKSRHILVADEAAAKSIIEQLQKGGDFVKLAAQLSTDTSNKDEGGDLGTQQPGGFVPEFDQVIFNAPIGLYPLPVKTTFGYHIIEVLSRAPRKLTDDEYEQKQGETFAKWLTDQRNNTALVTEYDRWKTSIPNTPTVESVQNDQATAQAQTATATKK